MCYFCLGWEWMSESCVSMAWALVNTISRKNIPVVVATVNLAGVDELHAPEPIVNSYPAILFASLWMFYSTCLCLPSWGASYLALNSPTPKRLLSNASHVMSWPTFQVSQHDVSRLQTDSLASNLLYINDKSQKQFICPDEPTVLSRCCFGGHDLVVLLVPAHAMIPICF